MIAFESCESASSNCSGVSSRTFCWNLDWVEELFSSRDAIISTNYRQIKILVSDWWNSCHKEKDDDDENVFFMKLASS